MLPSTGDSPIRLVVVNGDSQTYGDELSDRMQSCWGAVLARRLGADFVNLGVCAGSNRRTVRLTVERLDQYTEERGLTPDQVLFLGMWSKLDRSEAYTGEADLQGGLADDVPEAGWNRIHAAYIPRRDAKAIAWYRSFQSEPGDQSEFLMHWVMFDAWLAQRGYHYGFLWAFDPDSSAFENLPQYRDQINFSRVLGSGRFPYGGPSIYAVGEEIGDLAPGRHPLERAQQVFVDDYLFDWVSELVKLGERESATV
ncbi:DUF6071 family protein [Streptomyces sp. NPDC058459]|uniref:DUF6071 family protein n=1 Tax=Streptomyces sp. NPDC058459 TaxID=3346508 RepID=UPI0036615D5F